MHQSDLRSLTERRMTAGEDEPQPIVGHRALRLYGLHPTLRQQLPGLLVALVA